MLEPRPFLSASSRQSVDESSSQSSVREKYSSADISPKSDADAKKASVTCPLSLLNEQFEGRRVWISAYNPNFELCAHGEHRTLVLCFDGTGDKFDEDNTNIVQLFSTLRKDDNKRQMVYYQAGLGTYTDPVLKTPMLSRVSMALDQMVAWNLASHVKDGYAFLMQNYTHGDKICIFGFSRGAYTARALAGMLQKVGLLPVCNHQQLPFAYEMYKREDEKGLRLSKDFKETYSRPVAVDFLGVWDTVASVGLFPRYLPFIHANTGIRHLRHALALDERRVKFIPSFCVDNPEKDKPKEEQHSTSHQGTDRSNPQRELNSENGEKTDVEEVWFAGVHCDVGGGATPNWVDDKLSRIPLRWMIRECFKCNTGIAFDARMLQKFGLPVYKDKDEHLKLAPLYEWDPASPPEVPNESGVEDIPQEGGLAKILDLKGYEYKHDLDDCVCSANDRFKNPLWIILDWIPHRVKKQKALIDKRRNGDNYKWLWNRGQGRKIPKTEIKEGLKVHRSVKMRLEKLGEAYTPQARPNIRIARLDAKGNKVKQPHRMTHHQWNTPTPDKWKWVGESED